MARRVAVVAAAVALLLCGGAGAEEASSVVRQQPPAVARGLSFDFYKRSCPRAEDIVRGFVQDAVRRDVGLAAPGCSASTSTTASCRVATLRCFWTAPARSRRRRT
ncbi:unnamed protein product [Urochloa humidicola]